MQILQQLLVAGAGAEVGVVVEAREGWRVGGAGSGAKSGALASAANRGNPGTTVMALVNSDPHKKSIHRESFTPLSLLYVGPLMV